MRKQIKTGLRILCLIVFTFTLSHNTIAQKKGKQITYKSKLFSHKYYKGVWGISQEKAFGILKDNGESYSLAIKGKKLQKTGMITSIVGGALICIPLGLSVGGSEDPKWFLAGIGGGLVLFAIPIYSVGTRKIHQGVELYNETKATSYYENNKFIKKINLKAGVGNIGITMVF